MCSSSGNNRREKERGPLITIKRVPYFRTAGRRRNKCVPLLEIIDGKGTRTADSNRTRSLFSNYKPQKEQMCSAFRNNRREKERGLLITIERVPYFRVAGRRRNKCVPLSEIIGGKGTRTAGSTVRAFLIFVL
jgi:hypothetical protein